ncbi:BTAD domain-containing putative transcriptional regulator [Nocardioides sp.]|uniref:BTAD domain-containing putative transcriptional regulator n=1 Tax=Nocardioides sp. TaxID=35761 RepID=UPI003D0C9A92
MQYAVLGPLRALRDGRDVTPRGQRGRDVLALLILRRGQSVDPQVLLDQVWQSEATGLDATVVHTVVARLRHRLGADTIETTSTGYRLAEAPIDQVAFEDHLTRARGAPTTQSTAELRSALALWRADPAYSDVSQNLTATEQPRLAELRHSAQEALIDDLLASGDAAAMQEALTLAEDLILRDPLRERAHELVMLAAYRCGRQAHALAAYDRLRATLRDELGVDPNPSTQRLHARILAHDTDLEGAPAPGTTADPPPGAPAAPTTALIGRELELSTLDTLGSRRIVTIIGPGGVGKSTLLAEHYWRSRESGPVGYLDLANVGEVTEDEVAEAVAMALGVTVSAREPLDSLITSLTERRLTLFLDEAEWAGAALAPVVSRLVRACPRLCVVVSSRRALEIVGESRLVLDPLPCPAPEDDVEATRAAPAVRLLLERLADRDSAAHSDAEVLALGEVARRVDGLPLALELVAGYAGSRTVSELVGLLDTPLDLTTSELDRPARHRSLRDTVLWSAERLVEDERTTLRRLGIFVGEFDLSAAAAVVGPLDGAGSGNVAAICRSLAREALIQVRRTPDGDLTWRLLRTVRDLALEGLSAGPDLAATRARHREWHASRWRGALRNDRLLTDLRRHHDDYLAALKDALDTRDAHTTGDLVLTLGRWWLFTDSIGPGLRWTERCLASGLLNERQRAHLMVMRANLLIHQDPDASRAAAAEAVPVLERHADHSWLVGAHLIQALERHSSGDLEAAHDQSCRSVAAARHSTDERLADALGVLALIEAARGDVAATRASVDEAWSLARGSGSRAAMASVANNVCLALVEIGQADEAMQVLTSVEDRLEGFDMPLFLRHTSGWLLLVTGDPARALARFGEVVEQSPEAVADRRAAESYIGIGSALAELGRGDEASAILSGAQDLTARLGLVLPRWMTDRITQDGGRAATVASTEELGARLAGLVRSVGWSERSSSSSSS